MSMNFAAVFTPSGFGSLIQIILGDLTMAGDNVVVMGSLAAGLSDKDRKRVLLLGVSLALVFLIGFSLIAVQLLKITGLLFAGGLLLLWVAYNMFREIRLARNGGHAAEADAEQARTARKKTFLQAAIQITLADLSMSLDNVLLVASIARDNPALLFFGLTFSVLLMGLAANFVARLIQRYPWLSYIGLVVILYVAGSMIYEGIVDPERGMMTFLS